MEEIDNNELKFRMITPDGESFPVNSAPIEGWQNDIWKTFDEQKRVFDAEIKKAFEHCNVPLEETIERAELVVDKDDNTVLTIDKLPVLILYKPEFLYSKGKAVQRYKRLYEEDVE
ncbi:hypothetical protein ACR57_18515 [Bacillus subtilis]|nr:hypothetical protein [Bacillus subtilis]AIC40507.1 hypothetical protein BSUA_02227 [Bacillus subtilis subsp. subtilis str. JH642 substr. AG174]AIC44739.1 yoqA [Bacillus subtilis subsp. subtilis str. AG1839]AKC47646.1 hypothetical protein O7A_11375 [Bacillus subtilis KCTC 1028 = ATCC 6051a]APD21249.1 hypothetical protein phi3T_106 [Bacillus phage phi3T]AQR82073.1 hypothetical protein GP2222_22170 [Bacillus subtilis subsp. subtilis str. 168]EME05431.1 hypothetical protein BS732_3753 [Bacillu